MTDNVKPEPANPEKMEGTSLDIAEQRRRELKQLLPGVFTETTGPDGQPVETVDFERLKAELGTFSDVYEGRRERYGMEWPGKRDCMKLIQEPSRATLKPCREESVDFDTTQNLFIEGDNLEVLKLLQKSYYGKVKMIYIDPPYNTGNEFIYPDKYAESLETYLAYAGLVDDEGKKFSTNTAAEGRFHTKWLNMMYPRLYLARNLLRDDGVIFISIDDNEVENLRRICSEVFGEENFLAQIAWEKRYTRSNNAKRFYSLKDNILAYRKSDSLEYIKEKRTEKSDSNYSNPDDDPRGAWMTSSYVNPATKSERPNLVYEIKNPFTKEMVSHPTHAWKYSKEENARHVEENRLWWGKDGTAQYPRLKLYLSEQSGGLVPIDLWDYKTTGTTDEGGQEVKALFGKAIFDNPKPTRLIRRMLGMVAPESVGEEIILDFFAGSASTAHAVLSENAEDNGNRRYIMVQLPEPVEEDGYDTIADIAKQRIRLASKKLADELSDQLDLSANSPDLGFKVFKLDRSNFKEWQYAQENSSSDGIESQLEMHVDHVDLAVTQEDILYEVLLKAGFMPIEKIETLDLAGKQVFSIAEGALLICLEDQLTSELIDAVADGEPMQFICLDKGFKGNDQLKANAVQTFKSRSQGAETEMVFKVV